ncbi:MAG: energy-coupling factor transporter transmembrane protein EcfT [Acetobacter sp.]|nr:energy-coupling factor transporter transmembrane protein EcfT [Bacteroides sp.]MCM1340483.1 energy-coupling factor transporter transmembrane protein EcfT [Acetobacter sp.]MCM1433223.1 energy-coupling factor transporter transmembrane protein EcfT [Clostridiales bacterium]
MITDITIGQYFPGVSPIHKMDARMKIILTLVLIVTIFICKNIFSLLAFIFFTMAVIGVSKIPFKTIGKSIKPLAIIIVITALLNLFYGQGEPLVELGMLKITRSGIETAVFMAIRIITLVVISSLLTYTTSPTELTDALERLLRPLKIFKIDVHSISMTMTIALRFIPTLVEEIDKIMSAQKSRGAEMDSGGLIHRAKALIPVLIPLFVSAFRRANELAYAMECRCYRGGEGRTKMKVMKMASRDYISLVIVLLFMAVIIVMNHFLKNVI